MNELLEAELLTPAEERKLNSLISRAAAEDSEEHTVAAVRKVMVH